MVLVGFHIVNEVMKVGGYFFCGRRSESAIVPPTSAVIMTRD